MSRPNHSDPSPGRRAFLATLIGAAAAHAQTVNSVPAPRDWSGNTPLQYPEPDVVALDRRFEPYIVANTPMQRLYTGTFWSEGPAWNGVGRYLLWSDIPNNRQLRWTEEDGKVSVFRNPSNYSNGNTFDYQGRELSCEHGNRRVVRYEYDGTVSVIADHFEGKRFNSPNDIVVHPDGTIWFTDPTYGILGNYEGFKSTSEMKQAVYRVDPQTKQITKVNEDADQPNGICFTPDYKKLYVADTGTPQNVRIYDISGAKLINGKNFVQLDIPGTSTKSAPDGIRCDVDGNLWCGCRPGVQIVTPGGERIGMIRLPETCANIAFGGQKRNHLFMASSQSLYAVYVGTQGAHIC
jgi:gluconolactonase